MKIIDMVGKKFGFLTVLARSPDTEQLDKSGNVKWKCLCDCGVVVHLPGKWLRAGNNKSCGCSQYTDRSMLYGAKSVRWTGYKEIPGNRWSTTLRQARDRHIPVTITIQQAWRQFVKQGRRCALSGEPLSFFTANDPTSGTASLDRISSKLGYSVENIQWVHKDVNMMKWKLEQNRFVELCKKIATNRPDLAKNPG